MSDTSDDSLGDLPETYKLERLFTAAISAPPVYVDSIEKSMPNTGSDMFKRM